MERARFDAHNTHKPTLKLKKNMLPFQDPPAHVATRKRVSPSFWRRFSDLARYFLISSLWDLTISD